MDRSYLDTVRLLLDAAPEVFRAKAFAMKGGTALNLFLEDMPRLSVDIDVVFLNHELPRDAALAQISAELTALKERLVPLQIAAVVTANKSAEETKLLATRDNSTVKVEVNYVFRGSLLPPEPRRLVKAARDVFTVDVMASTLVPAELYGSKIVAALDRQHPRDFFDVHRLFLRGGLTAEIVSCFVAYLAAHNRPVHEVLFSRDLDFARAFEDEFAGMEREPVSLDALLDARARLRNELKTAITDAQKRFLLSLVDAAPEWSLMPFAHLAELPGLRWKLQNLDRLKRSNPAKFRAQREELAGLFER